MPEQQIERYHEIPKPYNWPLKKINRNREKRVENADNLNIDELAILILEQSRHYRVQYILHTRPLLTKPSTHQKTTQNKHRNPVSKHNSTKNSIKKSPELNCCHQSSTDQQSSTNPHHHESEAPSERWFFPGLYFQWCCKLCIGIPRRKSQPKRWLNSSRKQQSAWL